NRLEEMQVLEWVLEAFEGRDARAPHVLGNLLYARRRHREAIAMWEKSARIDGNCSVVWRNLGIAYFNVLNDRRQAREAFDKALKSDPSDARVLYERDQLWKRMGERPAVRLTELEKHPELVESRDDLSVELASLYNQTHQPEKALRIVGTRKFQPWEGGEGLALGQHVRAHLELGLRALEGRDTKEAVRLFMAALEAPENLGEAIHPLVNQSETYYWLGLALEADGD